MSRNTLSKTKNDEKVHVAVRCRPMNEGERRNRIKTAVETNMKDREVVVQCTNNQGKTYKFDKVFGPSSKQVDVYRSVVAPHIDEVLAGYNCTVLAYGQTGTGKTFTMEGERSSMEYSWEEDPKAGIIPRTLSQLFDRLEKESTDFSIHVSLLEIYNEVIYDLLSPTEEPARRRIYDDSSRKGSVIIADQTEIRVLDKSEVYNILEQGAAKRRTDATLMNEFSSRSHSVFTVTVHSKEVSKNGYEEEELVKIGKLNLVDLAGSENIGRSGAVEMRAREAGNINQSLLTLGRCITALVDHAPHVPYRESRLTRILQDSLGGATKTSIIATISPGVDNLEETLSTLDYASRAKNIHNRPTVNKKMTKRTLIKQYDNEIENLRRELQATREKNGVYMDKKQYEETKERLEELEITLQQRQEELNQYKVLFFDLTEEMRVKSEEYAILQQQFQEISAELMEQRYLKEVKGEHGTKTVEDANHVVKVADDMNVVITKVHDKVDRLKQADVHNLQTAKQSCNIFKQKVKKMNERAQEVVNMNKMYAAKSINHMDDFSERFQKEMMEFNELLDEWKSSSMQNMSDCMNTMCTMFTESRQNTEEQKIFLEKKQEMMAVCLSKIQETCSSQQKEMTSKFESLLKLSSNMKSFIKTQTVRQHEMVESHVESISKDLDQIVQSQRNMEINQEQDFTTAIDEMLDVIKVKFNGIKQRQMENIHSSGSTIRNNIDSIRGGIGTLMENSNSMKDELHNGCSAMIEETNLTLNALKDDADHQFQYCVEQGETSNNLVQESTSYVCSMLDNLKEDWKEAEERLQMTSNDMTETSTTFMSSGSRLLQQSGNSFSDDASAIKDSFQKTLNLQDEVSEIVHEGTSEVVSDINKFCEDDLIHVKPTGETPARKEYTYPRRFHHLPPDEEMIKSFHAKMAVEEEERKLLEEAQELEKEEEGETSSTEDENTPESLDSIDEEIPIPSGSGMPFFMAGKKSHETKNQNRIKSSRLPLRAKENTH